MSQSKPAWKRRMTSTFVVHEQVEEEQDCLSSDSPFKVKKPPAFDSRKRIEDRMRFTEKGKKTMRLKHDEILPFEQIVQ
jgi:hypothetical protein